MSNANPLVLRMRPQTARSLSVFVLVAVAFGYSAEAVFPALPEAVAPALATARLLGLLGAIALFLSNWGQQAMSGDDMIDERQQRERDRAFVLTHRWTVMAAIIGFFYVDLSGLLGLPLPRDYRGAADILNVFVLVSLAMPGIILAWQATTDVDDEA